MSVHDSAVLPGLASWGTTSGPTFGTKIIRSPSGFEQRVPLVSSDGRHLFRAVRDNMTDAEANEIESFAMCRNGAQHTFLFKDPRDFTNHQDGISDGSGEDDRIVIGVGTGTRVLYNLFKFYLSGDPNTNTDYQRETPITRPIPGTVGIWVDGSLKTIGNDYVLDHDCGQIRFLVAPAAGDDIATSFQFYKPVRFGQQVDEWLQARYTHTTLSAMTLDMVEVVDRCESREDVKPEGYLNGGEYVGVVDLKYEDGALQQFEPVLASPTVTGPRLRLFPVTNVSHGGPHVRIYNKSLVHTMRVHDADDAFVGLIGASQSAQFWWDEEDALWRLV